jgi:hypothetical protein
VRCGALAVSVLAGGFASVPLRSARADVTPPPAAPAAEAAPVSQTGRYSPYEEESIAAVARERGTEIDPAPEGKRIEAVDIVTLEVFEARDPAPRVFNEAHVTTREYVIRRELLLEEGDVYRKVLADETARNLRIVPQLSLVVVVALKGSSPERVRLAVITKDVWSLRLSWDLAFTVGGIERLTIQPTETNLLGRHQVVAGRFNLLPESYSAGARYFERRLFGSRIQLTMDANLSMNRRKEQPEGSFGELTLRLPLWSTRTPWAWAAGVEWNNIVARRYVNAALANYQARLENPDGTTRTENVPFQYRTDAVRASAGATRSFGWALKNDLSATFAANRVEYRPYDTGPASPEAVEQFRVRRMPRSDTRVFPMLQWCTYTTNFLRVLDAETLSLQEDFRLGHDLLVRFYPVSEALGSSRTFYGVFVGAQYTIPLGDGYARVGFESTTEAQADRLSDAAFEMDIRLVTPRLGFGRLVFDARLLDRYRNFLNRQSFLGGDTRLRGYPSSYLVGANVVAHTLEFRTRPVSLASVQVGGAIFYDSGDAFDRWSERQMKHSVGAGARVLFPQLDRSVFRLDFGFPVGLRPAGVPPMSFYFAFEQAFGVPTLTP